MPLAAKYGIVALVALAFTALPGGGATLDVVLTILSIAFFTAIAVLAYRLYHQFHFELDTLEDRQRLVLYGSIGLAILTFTGAGRLLAIGGAGVVVWLALLGLASYGLYWVWQQYRAYS